MIVFTATLTAKPGKEKELERALVDMVESVESEEGALAYVLHRSKEFPERFFFYEKYVDQKAWEFHDSTLYMKRLLEKLDSLLGEEIKIDHYEELASVSR